MCSSEIAEYSLETCTIFAVFFFKGYIGYLSRVRNVSPKDLRDERVFVEEGLVQAYLGYLQVRMYVAYKKQKGYRASLRAY